MKLFLISFAGFILLVSGCKKTNNDSVEITDKLDQSYQSASQLDESPDMTDIPAYQERGKLAKKIESEGFNVKKEGSKTNGFSYLLFVNDNGKIDKVMMVEGMGDKYDTILANSMHTWRLTPGKINGQKVKYRVSWKYHLLSDEKQIAAMDDQSNIPVNPGQYVIMAEVLPEIKGGMQELIKRIQYPESEKNAGKEGRVFVKVYINEEGTVDRTEVVRGVSQNLDAAAIKAIKGISFTPAKIHGKPVKIQVVIPISFKLE